MGILDAAYNSHAMKDVCHGDQGINLSRTRKTEYSAMERLFQDVLGLQLAHERRDFPVFRTSNGDTVEVFGPSEIDHRHFDAGPVVGFHVDDVAAARVKLQAAGAVELIGPLRSWPGGTASQHFRAPDGNVYEVLGPLHERDG